MSVLLGAVARRTAGGRSSSAPGGIERRPSAQAAWRGLRRVLPRGNGVDGAEQVAPAVVLDHGRCGAGHVDDHGDDAPARKPWSSCHGVPSTPSGAVARTRRRVAHGERGRELVLVDRARGMLACPRLAPASCRTARRAARGGSARRGTPAGAPARRAARSSCRGGRGSPRAACARSAPSCRAPARRRGGRGGA